MLEVRFVTEPGPQSEHLPLGGLLGVEHWLVWPGDLSKLRTAFFGVNRYISLAYLGCTLVKVWLG